MRDWFSYIASPNAYSWSVQSQKFFFDEAYTQALPYSPTLNTGQTVYAEIKVVNTGGITWNRSNTLLGTEQGKDRISSFKDAGWISGNRVTQLVETQVAPGGVGTFRFKMTAPQTTGSYNEYFNIVLEGATWLNDLGMYLPIKVANTRTVQLFHDSGRKNPLNSNQGYLNEPVYARATITNNTGRTLPANTAIATTNPADRLSALRHPSWISVNRVATLGSQLQYGQSATVDFILQPQTTTNAISEKFGLVIDGETWIDQGSITISYSNIERPKDQLRAGETLRPGDYIMSPNSQRRLVMQNDGNLVLYSGSKALWASWTFGG